MNLTVIPTTLQAGDSYRLSLSYAEYPASAGWSLSLSLAGQTVLSCTSEAEGDGHVIVLRSTETRALGRGRYRWSLRASHDDDHRTIAAGTLIVREDLAALPPGSGLTYPQQMLKICREARQNILRGELKGYMIGGRQTQLHTLAEVAREEAYWMARDAAESGRGHAGTHIGVTFVRR